MKYFLSGNSVIKWLETPSVYHIEKDELYELDDKAFEFLKECSYENGCVSDNKKFTNYCLKEDILSSQRSGLKYPKIKKSPVPSLRYLELQITDRCNLRCRHCYIPDKPGKELSLSMITRSLKELEDMQGLRVLITGGEPLLHSNFKDINSVLPKFFLRKILFTNGLLLNKQMLKNLNVNEIQVSIDGMEKAHDSLRGKGTFKRTMKNILLAMEYWFDVSVSTMVHPKNLDDFDEMNNLFKGMGIKEWAVDIPCIAGKLKKNAEFQITPEHGGKYLKYGFGGGIHSGEKGFGCGLHLMSVSANGKISKCTFYSDRSVGTVKDGLRKCWKKIKPVRLDKLECDCKYVEECRGGCRYRAEVLGKAKGKDLYRCALYKTI